MICYICDKTDWTKLDGYNKERLLQVCNVCGNVAYEVAPDEEARVRDYYRHQYRPAPNVTNLITSNHKLSYVRNFLADFLSGKKGLVCGDVGSAIGYIPNTLRKMGHRATGCELTVSYRRFSEHYYGVPLTEELDERYQYDLITIYHVLEHLIEPDKKLAKYVSLLKPEGRIMVSTPEWFDVLEEASGTNMASFEHLFHKDHINVFSRISIQNLFAKCGLEIEKENHVTYGQTYLLKKAVGPTRPMIVEDAKGQVEKINQIRDAISLLMQKKYIEASEKWPRFPEAYLNQIYDTYQKDPVRQERTFAQAMQVMPENSRVRLALAHWLYMQERFADSLPEWRWLIENRPSENVFLFYGMSLAQLGQHKEAMPWIFRASDMDPQKWAECINWVCHQAVQMPSWDERAMEQIKKNLVAEAAPVLVPNDPWMDPTGPAAAASAPPAEKTESADPASPAPEEK